MLTIFGIKNCDTMKKAFAWLDEAGLAYTFHDYKKQGIDAKTLQRWEQQVGWEALLNRRGTTWRKLPANEQATICQSTALSLMEAQPSLIKRPVVEYEGGLMIGFNADSWQQLK